MQNNNGTFTSGLSEQNLALSIKEKIQLKPGMKLNIIKLPISFDEKLN